MKEWYYRLVRWGWRIRKPLTLGVRAIVVDEEKGVLLLRHTYLPGWYLPGGGLEKGETFFDAIRRELLEECGVQVLELRLCHLYYSEREGKRDHIALFHVPRYHMHSDHPPDPEVAEMRFFHWDELPADTTPATRKRLDEFRRQEFHEERW
jgi:8-oxo-dGTP pyrophosphatase MutT (NUDIX family)